MEYPGNAALSENIKARIISTFEQTLESARQGKRQEAQLGCDFILKLDGDFEPARKLADLLRSMGAAASEGEEPAPDHLGTMRSLAEGRRFRDLLEYASAHEAAVSQDAGLKGLLDEAKSLLEAEPYVASFLQSARQAAQQGDMEKVSGLIAKAKALDPAHPGIGPLEQLARTEQDPSATVKIPLDFSLDLEEPVGSFSLGQEDAGAAPAFEVEAAEPAPPAAIESEALEEDPLAAFAVPSEPAPVSEPAPDSGPSSLGDGGAATGSDPLEDAFASTSAERAEPPAAPVSTEEDDPFAALEAGLGSEAEDDPFAAFSLAAGDDASEISADELARSEDASLENDVFGAESTADEAPDSGDERINELLADGQSAFEQGDHQGAIDAWSRIFLIDVDNEDASRRIERARTLKAEGERQVEEVYHEGLNAWEQVTLQRPREAFEQVLGLQPSHVAANELLEQIAHRRGGGPTVAATGGAGSRDGPR